MTRWPGWQKVIGSFKLKTIVYFNFLILWILTINNFDKVQPLSRNLSKSKDLLLNILIQVPEVCTEKWLTKLNTALCSSLHSSIVLYKIFLIVFLIRFPFRGCHREIPHNFNLILALKFYNPCSSWMFVFSPAWDRYMETIDRIWEMNWVSYL